MDLVRLLEKPLLGLEVTWQWAYKKYCLIMNCYTDNPKKIKGESGEESQKYIECYSLYIRCFSDEVWNTYVSAARECQQYYSGKDSIILRIQEPRLVEQRTALPAFADQIKLVEENRKVFTKQVEEKIDKCFKELREFGVNLNSYTDEYDIIKYTDDCLYRDEWYDIKQVNNYNDGRTMIIITMHKDTALYKLLTEGGEGLCLLDRVRQGPMKKIA